jgi:hypothetical protein
MADCITVLELIRFYLFNSLNYSLSEIYKPLYVLFLLVYLFSASCKRPRFNDLGGIKTLNGVALLHDNYAASGNYTPLSNITIYLRNKDDVNGYLSSTRTDDNGQFSFTGIDTTKSYRVDASYKSAQLHYTGFADVTPSDPRFLNKRDTLLLGVDGSLQNGVHIEVKDYLGGAVPNATVWMFSSPASFLADTSANATFSLLTDNFGIVNQHRIAPGDYYFRVKIRSGGIELVDETKASVEQQAFNR